VSLSREQAGRDAVQATPPDLAAELRALEGLSVPALVARHRELYGREPRSRNRESLVRRIAWRLQEQAMGGLSGAARRRLAELTEEIDLGGAEKPRRATGRVGAAPRGLAPGSTLTREWRGSTIEVRVRADGTYEWDGQRFRSLSAATKAITSAKWNPSIFWGLAPRKRKAGQ